MKQIYSVSEVTHYIKSMITNDHALSALYVRGEISNLTMHSSKHIYLTLKDQKATLKCVMFASNTRSLKFVPKNGMKVVGFGYFSVFEKSGTYQFYLSELVSDGLGDLYIALEQLKKKLEIEGYFEQSRKRKIPEYPDHVSVITAKDSAAANDFLDVAKRRYSSKQIDIYDVHVQGIFAKNDIARAIRLINEKNKSDVIVITRGGGSIEDLFAFNEEIVARAIFNSRIPVMSAIGHEIDYTIADLVADERAITPTDASLRLFKEKDKLNSDITYLTNNMFSLITNKIDNQRKIIENIENKNVMKDFSYTLDRYYEKLDYLLEKQKYLFDKLLQKVKSDWVYNTKAIEQLSPMHIMKRGFSYVTDENGETIKSINQVALEEKLQIKVKDGIIVTQVKEVVE